MNTIFKKLLLGFSLLCAVVPAKADTTLPTLLSLTYFTNFISSNVLSSVKSKYGVVGDGVTDDSVKIQTALNAGGEIWFPPGRYVVANLYATNNTHVHGVGAVLQFKAGTTNALLDATGATNNFSIEDITFDGQDYSDMVTRPFGTRHGMFVNAGAQNCSASINVLGFDGYGTRITSTYPGSGAGNIYQRATFQILNPIGQSNFCGLAMISPDDNTVGEYVTVLNPDFANNRFGIIANAGNHKVVGGKLTDNDVGARLSGGSSNAHHGSFEGVTVNHNHGCAFLISDVANGELIKDCLILANPNGIWLTNANSVCIEGCYIQTGVISWSGGSNNRFVNNMYGGVWGGSFNFTALDNSFVYYGNHSEDNAGDTDGHFNMDYAGNTAAAGMFTFGAGVTTHSNTPPTGALSNGDVRLWSSNGVAYLIQKSSAGTVTTNKIGL